MDESLLKEPLLNVLLTSSKVSVLNLECFPNNGLDFVQLKLYSIHLRREINLLFSL